MKYLITGSIVVALLLGTWAALLFCWVVRFHRFGRLAQDRIPG